MSRLTIKDFSDSRISIVREGTVRAVTCTVEELQAALEEYFKVSALLEAAKTIEDFKDLYPEESEVNKAGGARLLRAYANSLRNN